MTEIKKLTAEQFDKLSAKEKANYYYRCEELDNELKDVLRSTRQEPGLSLQEIANIIKEILKEDTVVLIKLLEK
jgi:succinate dehydrogenase flavin-adding protein (antitoxin of CptAB toxin-antitoxin module)